MSLDQFSMEEISRNKWAYLKMVYALTGFNTLFYIVRFNVEYGVPDYNWILIPLWILMMVVPPAFIRFSGSYKSAAISVCSLTTLLTLVLVYLAGGLEAPGLLWLAAVPLVLGMLLGIRGAGVGYLVVFITLVIFVYTNLNGIGPNLIEQYGMPKLEKIINLCGFIVFASVTAHYYHKREERVAARLLQKNTDVENLLRVLMHDIANTLSRMTYDLVRHKEGHQSPTSSAEIDKIEKAMEDINTLLFQVRHMKSIKDGKSPLPLKGISLTMILHEVYEKVESLAQQKGIKLYFDIPREKIWVKGDKTILSNVVLLNLLTNAIKFSYAGDQVDLRAYPAKDSVIIEIQDYGIGIPADILANLFSVNYNTSRAGTFGETGTGYGLPLVKEYLQLMGGAIEISSREKDHDGIKRGTLVRLHMPLVTFETTSPNV